MTTRIYTDTRISIDLCAWNFEQIIQEYMKAIFGTYRVLGGYTMSWDKFETRSYATRETSRRSASQSNTRRSP